VLAGSRGAIKFGQHLAQVKRPWSKEVIILSNCLGSHIANHNELDQNRELVQSMHAYATCTSRSNGMDNGNHFNSVTEVLSYNRQSLEGDR
jgi:hypothetical protein